VVRSSDGGRCQAGGRDWVASDYGSGFWIFYFSAFEAQVERRLLSGSDQPAQIRWRQAATGREAAVQLARKLGTDIEELLGLGDDFRPAIVHVSTRSASA
jgi:hypothetical protein